MGNCIKKINCCSEWCCYVCCICGEFYHMQEEGNLTCAMVKDCCKLSSNLFVLTMINDEEIFSKKFSKEL